MSSTIRNAYIDFTKMTTSVVAVVTDVVRNGRPVVGYGFNSNGRYAASGLLRDRFLPRLREADPSALLTDDGANLDPHRICVGVRKIAASSATSPPSPPADPDFDPFPPFRLKSHQAGPDHNAD